MKDVSEKLEEVILGTWEKPKPLPDRIYFMKVFRRNLGVFFLGAGVTIIVALSLPYLIENTYKSSVHAIFDHVDVSGSGLGTSPQVRYNTVARLFRARFESQDFLSEIAGKLGGRAAFMQEGPMAQFILNPIKSKLGLINKSDSTADDRVALSQVLSKQLDAFPEPESGVLTLSAYTASPKLSQSLANEAMELFIRKELDEQIRSLDIKLDFLQKNSLREAPPKIQKEKVQVVESRSARVNRLQVDDQQTESEDRLRSLNVQLDNLKIEREQSLTAVSRELVKLQTSLQPNHPQVIEKRKEIDLLNSQYAAHEAKLMSNLDEARAQLRGLRSLQPIPGPAGQSTSSVSSIDYRGNFFMAVTDRIKDIELERKNLQRQRDDVKLRTRLRIIFPAAYEPIPYKNNRRNLSLTLAAAGAALTFLFIAFRELRNSKARDVWRIERGSGQSIVAQISLKSATEFADITPKLADQLRTHLSKISKVDDAARTLLSYRRLELAMVKGCQGRLVMLINAGPFDETAKVIKNFLNIYATDHQDDYLLIDCNLQDPIHRKIGSGHDLVDFWEGRSSFDKVVLPREELEGFAFDLIPPMLKFSGEKTRSFREDMIEKALSQVPAHYKKIFIRAMPESHFIENMALLNVATDAFIFVDADKTNYFDLYRTLTHLQSEKMRGLIALGT